MTRDEILKLTDEELRVAIAKAQGMETFEFEGELFFVYIRQGDCEGCLPVPDYPRDIAAAWELIEEMRTAHADPGVYVSWEFEKGWEVNFAPDYDAGCVIAETAARAISLAWLIWKDGAK